MARQITIVASSQLNAVACSEAMVAGRSIRVILQPLNALVPMVVTLLGMERDVNLA